MSCAECQTVAVTVEPTSTCFKIHNGRGGDRCMRKPRNQSYGEEAANLPAFEPFLPSNGLSNPTAIALLSRHPL